MIRLLNRLDARHPILTRAAALLIAFGCLYWSAEADKQNDAAIRWSMAAGRST